jgi:hypothetical protein
VLGRLAAYPRCSMDWPRGRGTELARHHHAGKLQLPGDGLPNPLAPSFCSSLRKAAAHRQEPAVHELFRHFGHPAGWVRYASLRPPRSSARRRLVAENQDPRRIQRRVQWSATNAPLACWRYHRHGSFAVLDALGRPTAWGVATTPSNKRMKLTRLSAARSRDGGAASCARRRGAGRTASQLIRGVLRTHRGRRG